MVYMGGKSKLAKYYLPIMLADRKEGQLYVEPFAGGMNMIDKVTENRWANDNNIYLIAMWQELLNGWNPPFYTKEEYTDIRLNKEKYPLHIVGYVGFNCSFKGKFFGGYSGIVTGKHYHNYQDEKKRNIQKQTSLLQNIKFTSLDYNDMVFENSIVYCDPPYKNTTEYKNKFNTDSFWEWVYMISTSNNNTVFISEYTAPDNFECIYERETVSVLRSNDKIGKKQSVEKLFTLKK